MGRRKNNNRGTIGKKCVVNDQFVASLLPGNILNVKVKGLRIPSNRPHRILKAVVTASSPFPVNMEVTLFNADKSISVTTGATLVTHTASRITLRNNQKVNTPANMDGEHVVMWIINCCSTPKTSDANKYYAVFNVMTYILLLPEDIERTCPATVLGHEIVPLFRDPFRLSEPFELIRHETGSLVLENQRIVFNEEDASG